LRILFNCVCNNVMVSIAIADLLYTNRVKKRELKPWVEKVD